MVSPIPPLTKPNNVAIGGMIDSDLLRVREYYIVVLLSAKRRNDSDTMNICLDWLDSLTSEMRLRGAAAHSARGVTT